jgi:chromosomal replication initiator protein
MAESPAGAVWSKTCQVLKRELGDATFGSWLGQASLRETGDEVCVVAATGVAADWIRRHAWRRIGELWAQNDPLGRRLDLKSRLEVESAGAVAPPPAAAPVAAHRADVVAAVSAPEVFEVEAATAPVAARQGRLQGLQERFSFDSFVSGPANEFAFAVARRVASW